MLEWYRLMALKAVKILKRRCSAHTRDGVLKSLYRHSQHWELYYTR